MEDVVRARWSEQIHEEWIESLLSNRPDLDRAQLERTRRLMDEAVPGALVTGFEHHIPNLSLPDPDDRHVLAAAIESEVDTIVTFNLEDFPEEVIDPVGLAAQSPNDWIVQIMDENRELVVEAARRQRAALSNPSKTEGQFLRALAQSGLPTLVERLRNYPGVI